MNIQNPALFPDATPYTPPRPKSLGPLSALLRAAITQDSNLIGLLPKQAYRERISNLGYSRRSIVIINDPKALRTILTNPSDIYPKNDLMVGALEPLVGESVFVSNGEAWRRQRAMIAPAFSHMKLEQAFTSMEAAVADYSQRFDELADENEPFSLDLAMSHLTADVICRTVFSTPLASQTAKEVYEDFSFFERSVAHVEIARLIFSKPFERIPHTADVLEACERIRSHLGLMVDNHLKQGANFQDIAMAIVRAQDENGTSFTRKELIDQLGVFFLAGHETTASALTWAFYICATKPEFAERVRAEIAQVCGTEPLNFRHVRQLTYTRSIFKETMRLYPPITFIPRVAAQETRIMGRRIKRGAMVMIAPWAIHRHHDFWENPDVFDPDRFSPQREKEIEPYTYMPFGLGPRVCVGANFATIEATLILAALLNRFDFSLLPGQSVKPVARLTTRPEKQIMMRVRYR